MSNNIDRVLIALTVVGTLCVVPFLLRFERSHPGWDAKAGDRIATMSQSEREDLLANRDRLKNDLSPEKRQAVEAIYTATADPEVAARLDAYDTWLQGISVAERDTIRSAETPDRQVAEVQSLLAASEERDGFYIDADDSRIRHYGEEFVEQLTFDMASAELSPLWVSDREYNEIITIFVDAFPEELREDFEDRISKVSAEANESALFRARSNAMGRVMLNHFRKHRASRGDGSRRELTLPWMTTAKVNATLNAFEDSQKREALLSLSEQQKEAIVNAIGTKSMDQFRFMRPYLPSDQQIKEYFLTLERDVRIELMGRSSRSQRIRLNLMYVASGGSESGDVEPEIPEDIVDMANSIMQQLSRFDSARRGRDGRGGRDGRDRGGRRESRSGDKGGPTRPRQERPHRPK